MNFNALFVSLIPIDDELFKTERRERKIEFFEEALDKSKERSDDYSIKIHIFDRNEGLMAGVISRKTKVELHNRDFKAHQDESPLIY